MVDLLLMRHAQAKSGHPDFARPLSKQGKHNARRVGNWLLSEGIFPEVICSPAERALITAQKCIKAAGGSASAVKREDRIYEAGLGDLLAVLDDIGPETTTLLVGHNPSIAQLMAYLTGNELATVSPGCVARLSWSGQAEPGSARMEAFINPEMLPEV